MVTGRNLDFSLNLKTLTPDKPTLNHLAKFREAVAEI